MMTAVKKSILKLKKKASDEKSCCCSKKKQACDSNEKPTKKELELCQAIVD